MTIRRLLPGILLSSVLLVGCTGQDVDTPATEQPTTAPETTSEPTDAPAPPPTPSGTTDPMPTETPTDTPPTDAPPSGPFDTNPKQSEGFPDLMGVDLLPTEIRVAHHDGYDRVVVEFDGDGTMGYRAQYVDEAHQPGSGDPITVPGSHVMEVIITGTRMPEEGEDFANGEYGVADATVVEGVRFSPPFEGQSLLVIGVDGERPFLVQTLEGPSRLVIDIQN